MASQPLPCHGPAQGGRMRGKVFEFLSFFFQSRRLYLWASRHRHAPCMLVFPNHCCILKFLWFLVSLFLIFLLHFRCEYCFLILSISFVWFLCFLQQLSRRLIAVCSFLFGIVILFLTSSLCGNFFPRFCCESCFILCDFRFCYFILFSLQRDLRPLSLLLPLPPRLLQILLKQLFKVLLPCLSTFLFVVGYALP